MEEKAVYKLNADCGRSGVLEGLFIATKAEVKMLIEKQIEVYFGEVLGKHSEIYGEMDNDDIDFVSDAPEVIAVIEKHELTNGFNPFEQTTINFDFEENKIVIPDGDFAEDMTVREIVEQLIKMSA